MLHRKKNRQEPRMRLRKHGQNKVRVDLRTAVSEGSERNTADEKTNGKEKATEMNNIHRGDIYYADLSPVIGSEQGGLRPVLIIQNDVGNRYSPTVIAAAITSKLGKTRLPTHIDIYARQVGLAKDSVVLLEQVRTLDKRRLKEKMGHLDDGVMNAVNSAIAVSFGLGGDGADYGGDAGEAAAIGRMRAEF